MKNLLLIIFCFLYISASAQQNMFGKTLPTVSEYKAQIMIEKLNKEIQLAEEQKQALEEITSDYLDDLQEIRGENDFAEQYQKITIRRDKRVKRILNSDSGLSAYQKCIKEILLTQQKGYGRG
jgi:hypothetical protein